MLRLDALTTKQEEQLEKAKESRFTLSSRILTGKNINVNVINQLGEKNSAFIDMNTLQLTLNEALPKADNPVIGLIYDRGKLYHELGHALYTVKGNREKLMEKSCNPQRFLDVSNVLEDGRIERLMSENFKGTSSFFDSLLNVLMSEAIQDKGKASPFASLVLYVRKKAWRNSSDAKYWSRFETLINEAVACDNSNRVCQIAFEIVEALNSPKQQGENKQPSEGDKGNGGSEGDCKGKGNGNGNSGSEGKAESNESQSEEQGTDEKTDSKGCNKSVAKMLRDIVDDAMQSCDQSASEEWNGILDEVENGTEQEYANGTESDASSQLTEIFRSVLTETQRTKTTASREGLLNSLALPKALTSRRCFNERVEGASRPAVALLLDCSGSMLPMKRAFSAAARILNGSLRAAGIDTLTVGFGVVGGSSGFNGCAEFKSVDVNGLICAGSTPTANAMKIANNWLEEKGATRGLVIVCTDGIADSVNEAEAARLQCNALGGHVLGVYFEREGFPLVEDIKDMQFNSMVTLNDVTELPLLLEPVIVDYINGVQ